MATANIQVQQLEPLYEIEQAGQYLHRSPWTIRRDIREGKIRCLRLGRRILIEHSELVRLLDAARQAASA
jgi:excisionase family DNA binding protein